MLQLELAAEALDEGNRRAARKEFAAAKTAYGKGLGEPSLASQIMRNISSVLHKKNDFSRALTYAAAASVSTAEPKEAAARKGRVRAAAMLRALGATQAEIAWRTNGDRPAKYGVEAVVKRGGAPLPSPKANRTGDAATLKAAGNVLFASGDWDGALVQYLLALAALPITEVLLRKRALCSLALGLDCEGCLESIGATVADPSKQEAWFCRAKATLKAGWREENMAALNTGFALAPAGNAGIVAMYRCMDAMQIAGEPPIPMPPLPPAGVMYGEFFQVSDEPPRGGH